MSCRVADPRFESPCGIRDSRPLACRAETDENEVSRCRRRHCTRWTVGATEHGTASVPRDRALTGTINRQVEGLARGVRPAVGLARNSQRIACCRGAMSPHISAVSAGARGKLSILHPVGIADGRRGEREQHTHHEARYDHHATSGKRATATTFGFATLEGV